MKIHERDHALNRYRIRRLSGDLRPGIAIGIDFSIVSWLAPFKHRVIVHFSDSAGESFQLVVIDAASVSTSIDRSHRRRYFRTTKRELSERARYVSLLVLRNLRFRARATRE